MASEVLDSVGEPTARELSTKQTPVSTLPVLKRHNERRGRKKVGRSVAKC